MEEIPFGLLSISKTNANEEADILSVPALREIKSSRTSGEPRRGTRGSGREKRFGPADAFPRLHPRMVFARDFFLRPHVATDVNLAPINSVACARERSRIRTLAVRPLAL